MINRQVSDAEGSWIDDVKRFSFSGVIPGKLALMSQARAILFEAFILFRGPRVRCSLSLLSLHFTSPGTALPSTSLDEFLETL